MDTLIDALIRRFPPRVGWVRALLALALCLCASFASSGGPLNLPSTPFALAALVALPLGLLLGRPGRHTATVLRGTLLLCCASGGALLLLLWVGGALPPLGLIWQDARALPGAAPFARTLLFLAASTARAETNLLAAPAAGEAGARLLLFSGGLTGTWCAALLLGWALARGRPALAWATPMLGMVLLLTLYGGGSPAGLLSATALTLLLAVAHAANQREATWAAQGIDRADDLRGDALLSGTALTMLLITIAALVPAWANNPIASALFPDLEPPSGLAALERQARTTRPTPPPARIALSQLPALSLGESIAQDSSETPALTITLAAPPPTDAPYYWRARVFEQYTGRIWQTGAQVVAFSSTADRTGTIEQRITDERAERRLLAALPDVVAADVPLAADRLPDGGTSALTGDTLPRQYTVWSQLMPPTADPTTPPPDLAAYTGLPSSVSARVRELARALTGNSTDPFVQALALERYLRDLPYSYRVTPLPERGDAVDFFLFETQTGYCTYYASAMAVMARSIGIPARVATGYATGQYDAATSTYRITERDAHAWPELLLNGRWVAFEPTPVQPLPARNGNATPQPPAIGEEQMPVPMQPPLRWPQLAAIFAVAGCLAALLWHLRRRAGPLDERLIRDLERYGTRRGIRWPPGATLHEYGALLTVSTPHPAIPALIDELARRRYSPHHGTLTDTQLVALWRTIARPRSVARHMRQSAK